MLSRILVAVGLVAVLGTTPARADKCLAYKLRVVAKLEKGLLQCQAKHAARPEEDLASCEQHVKASYALAFANAGSCLGDQTACENAADACEAAIANAMMDTSASQCEASKRRAAATLASKQVRCWASGAAQDREADFNAPASKSRARASRLG
jgi:hypothetical protein